MPVFNSASHVGEAVASVLTQTVDDLEAILIDDGSTDGTRDILESFRDPRIRLLRHEETLGVTRRLNEGLDAATGRYVARMDADDICLRHRFEKQLSFMEEHSDLDVCGSWICQCGAGRSFTVRYPVGAECLRAYVLFSNPLAHPTVFLRKASVDRLGLRYRDECLVAQDYDLWSRRADDLRMDNVPEVLLNYRVHPSAVTSVRHSESERTAGWIAETHLRRLGLVVGQEELRRHLRVGHGTGEATQGGLAEAEAWLLRILAANERLGVWGGDGLRAASAFVWFRLCLNSAHLGRVAWRTYRRSVLARWYAPGLVPTLTFALLALRGAATKGRSGPTGQRRST
jgi:glycosyltransferase involved in cell wall biosynthesis